MNDDQKEIVIDPQKETVHVENVPELVDEERGTHAVPVAPDRRHSQKPQLVKERLKRRIYGIRTLWILLGIALLLILIIILGIGLGIGLRSG